MQVFRVERPFGAQTLILESGKIAKQAHGAVVVRYGDTVTLTASTEGEDNDERDFFPLTVDYREKTYSAGKFPGGFIKREGRPTTKEILTCRLIDRPIRPLFPANYHREVQVMASVRSFDRENDPDILCMIGASASLHVSQIPFLQPTGSVRVGRVNGQLVVLPTHQQLEESDLDLIVAGTKSAITMIEGFSREMKEEEMVKAILFAHDNIRVIVEMIEELRRQMGKPDKVPPAPVVNPVYEDVKSRYSDDFKRAKMTEGKAERAAAVKELKDRVHKEMTPTGDPPAFTTEQVKAALSQLEERVIRDSILEGKRMDGRPAKLVRPLYCEVGIFPRTHGSAIFQRGETQAVVTATLGTVSDEQRIDGLLEEFSKKFMLDYNMPPYAVGECRRISGPGRREIGHGMLAERSLRVILPDAGDFPYTIRLVSEIEESNGSSSMASVCGGTLALMDAGVPIKEPVAGISIGLVKEGDRYVLLTDIMGDEDHYGDMDFKVAGTGHGITGIQLDLKIDGINEEIIRGTLQQAKEARFEILRFMLKNTLREPRSEISRWAPRMLTVQINPEKIGALIGPGGKNIKAIQESTGAKIDIKEDGQVFIAHSDAAGAEAARAKVEAITEEVKIGRVYEGKVVSIREFGAFIEIAPGKDALCHISELADSYVGRVEDVVQVGDKIAVKVIAIDEQDRVKVSRKALLREQSGGGEGGPPPEEQPRREPADRGPDRGGDRGGRGGDRGGRGGDRGGRGGGRGGDRGGRGGDRPPRRGGAATAGGGRGPSPAERSSGAGAGTRTAGMNVAEQSLDAADSTRTAPARSASPRAEPGPDGDRYAELAELAGGFVHEIKNHLGTLKLQLELLAEDFQDAQSPREKRAFAKIQKLQGECQRLDDTSKEFLAFARLNDLERVPCDLADVVDELIEFYSPTAERAGIRILRLLPADLPPVLLNREVFKQALLNMFLNAQQAMPNGGDLTIQASVETSPTPHHNNDGKDGGPRDRICLSIIDTGDGMTPDVAARIFRPFFSTRPGGTGLGLPTTRKIIEAHEGTIDVQSAVGRGTRFAIRLPLAGDPSVI